MIDWQRAESALCLKGKTMAEMAGISESLWSQIKHGKRPLHPAKELMLLIRLTHHFNLDNSKTVLQHACVRLEQVYAVLEQNYPQGAPCGINILAKQAE